MTNKSESVDALLEIRKMMSQSSRVISLSGLSGVGAGIVAMLGAFAANYYIHLESYMDTTYSNTTDLNLVSKLILIAVITMIVAVGVAIFFTLKKAKKSNLSFWNIATKKLVINLVVPLVTGGILILKLISINSISLIAPLCLIFYGLGLINASKYTYGEIKYLGYCELVLGLINLGIIGYGRYFWVFGFGILHIVYGILMWNKYDKIQSKKH